MSIEMVGYQRRIDRHDGVLQAPEALLFKNVLRLRIRCLESKADVLTLSERSRKEEEFMRSRRFILFLPSPELSFAISSIFLPGSTNARERSQLPCLSTVSEDSTFDANPWYTTTVLELLPVQSAIWFLSFLFLGDGSSHSYWFSFERFYIALRVLSRSAGLNHSRPWCL